MQWNRVKSTSGAWGHGPAAVSLAVLAMCAMGLPGCKSSGPLPPDAAFVPTGDQRAYHDDDWAYVLRRFVREGLVDYEALARQREPLERYYALVSVTGPRSTPDDFNVPAEATAYWINVYNALVLAAVMETYPVETMYDLSLPSLEHGYAFQVDGRPMVLADIQAELWEQTRGDVRVLLALSKAAMGTPRLRNKPMRAATLHRQLEAAAAEALDNPFLLKIDHATRSIYVYQLVFRRQSDFVDWWRRTHRSQTTYPFNVLMELASPARRRAMQSAVGYTLRQMPFDRRLNQWSPQPPEQPVVP